MFRGEVPIRSITRNRFGAPVRIARSALGADVPNEDLYVTRQHALLIDGTLVAAGNLFNGTTITGLAALDFNDFEFFHIGLERHNVIYANGAPCETLLSPGEQPCAPLLAYGWRRGLLKSHLRSAVAPWIDRRQPIDVIRDGLDARGAALLRGPELLPLIRRALTRSDLSPSTTFLTACPSGALHEQLFNVTELRRGVLC